MGRGVAPVRTLALAPMPANKHFPRDRELCHDWDLANGQTPPFTTGFVCTICNASAFVEAYAGPNNIGKVTYAYPLEEGAGGTDRSLFTEDSSALADPNMPDDQWYAPECVEGEALLEDFYPDDVSEEVKLANVKLRAQASMRHALALRVRYG